MRKLVKKYEEFVYGNTERERTVTPVKPGIDTPSRPAPPAPSREKDPSIIPVETPSVNPDPLAELSYELEGSELKGNTLYYKGHEIEYPSEFTDTKYGYTVDGKKLGKDYKEVIDYLSKLDSYYDAEYDKPELSDVTIGEDGELNNFDAEYDALRGKNNIKESKSYKDTRKFNKRK